MIGMCTIYGAGYVFLFGVFRHICVTYVGMRCVYGIWVCNVYMVYGCDMKVLDMWYIWDCISWYMMWGMYVCHYGWEYMVDSPHRFVV